MREKYIAYLQDGNLRVACSYAKRVGISLGTIQSWTKDTKLGICTNLIAQVYHSIVFSEA